MPTKAEIDAFIAVAQCGSVTAAAEQLYITQPALSRRILSLETEVGSALFERGRGAKGTVLTREGKLFAPIARRWLAVHRETISFRESDRKPTLRVAAVGSVSAFLAEWVLPLATADSSEFRLDFHLCHSSEGHALVADGLSDVAFIDFVEGTSPYSTSSVVATPAYSVPFSAIGGKSWRGRKSVSANELDPAREVLLPWNASFDAWRERTFGGKAPYALLDTLQVLPSFLHDDLFAFVPETECVRISTESSEFVPLSVVDGPPDEVICLLEPAAVGLPCAAKFIELAKRAFASNPHVRCLL